MNHDHIVIAQFDGQAAAYATSSVHAQGEDLQEIAAYAASIGAQRVLDMGCGGGHVALSVASTVAEVVAYDVSPQMLSTVAKIAQAKGLSTISTVLGSVESMPFDDASFDCVITRFSAHHWHHFERGLDEARRMLRSGGKALFADIIAPEETVCDTFLQTIEMLRDSSHVRDYRLSQWHAALHRAGFTPTKTTPRRLRLDFAEWLGRMQTPDVRSAAIRSLQTIASTEITTHFALEADGTFTVDSATIQAVAV